ncbi:MAG TPA: class I SAM-dependent methyltransferase [Flavobacteriales bacterium]|nr:class I SAM-dependent methyltransferase [Flavobacteriales bacterium]
MKLSELTSRYDIGKVLNAMGLTGRGVEVGVAFGEYAEIILRTSSLSRLTLVDPWDYVPYENPKGFGDAIKDFEGCYRYCIQKVAPFIGRVAIDRTTSVIAASDTPDGWLDFCFIDANHMRPMIDRDLKAWWPKMKVGGIFGGHDYHMVATPVYTCQVKAAVDQFFAGKPYQVHVTNEPGDAPSWFVIK